MKDVEDLINWDAENIETRKYSLKNILNISLKYFECSQILADLSL